MINKEYAQRVFTRATWYDKHGDRTPNDFGPPAKLYYADQKPMSKQEEEEYYDKLADIELDSPTF